MHRCYLPYFSFDRYVLFSFVGYCRSASGWDDGSYFYIEMDGIDVLRTRLEGSSRSEVKFDPTYVISTEDSWRYSNSPQSTVDWYHSVNPTWTSYVPGSFPTVSTNTRYYALSVTVPPMWEGYYSFELGIYSREGVVAYINGEEVIRKNLPAGPVNSDTQVTSLDHSSQYLRFIGSKSLYLSGSSVLVAVEIHKDYNVTSAYTDDFKAYLLPHQQGKGDGSV